MLVTSGRLDIDDGVNQVSASDPSSLLLVEPYTCADTLKTPGGDEQRFQSIFLTFSPSMLNAFQAGRDPVTRTSAVGSIAVDDDVASTLRYVLESIEREVSDDRLQYRLMDMLAALAERGHSFHAAPHSGIAVRLRTMIGEAPERPWTAQEAGRALAMSEATLRRRLTSEQVGFEDLLIDVRMHHAMMLVQTTSWNMPRIAEACGYKSRARFAERFRERFGRLPSTIR